jgi:hypothetical protein
VVRAAAAAIRPWFVQMGQRRAGFYTASSPGMTRPLLGKRAAMQSQADKLRLESGCFAKLPASQPTSGRSSHGSFDPKSPC